MGTIHEHDTVLLLSGATSYLVSVEKRDLHTSSGVIELRSIIGKRYGCAVMTHKGHEFVAVKPSTTDLLEKKLKRLPATIHLKDIGFIIAVTGIHKNSRVVEAGTGSGHATFVLSQHVARVYSYETRTDFYENVKKHFDAINVSNVVLKNKSILNGIDERQVDLVLLDMKGAELAIPHAFKAMKPGGYLTVYSPYIEQVKAVTEAVHRFGFSLPETTETIMRFWDVRDHTLPKRAGMMHTAFITIARKVSHR